VVFDHTVRESGSAAGVNALGGAGQAAAPVLRAHCDYTEASGPKRVAAALAEDAARRRAAGAGLGVVATMEHTVCDVVEDRSDSRARQRAPWETSEGLEKPDDDADDLAAGRGAGPGPAGGGDDEPRYAIINVWRGVPGEARRVPSYSTSSVK